MTQRAGGLAVLLFAGAITTSSIYNRLASGFTATEMVSDFGRTSSLEKSARLRNAAQNQDDHEPTGPALEHVEPPVGQLAPFGGQTHSGARQRADTPPRQPRDDNPRQDRPGKQRSLHRQDLEVGIDARPGQPAPHPSEVCRQQDAGILQLEHAVAGKNS